MADTITSFEDDGQSDLNTIIAQAIDSALLPLRILTSPAALKTYISILLFSLFSLTLLSISSTAYAVFYYNYIPPINLEVPLYLQYGATHAPFALEKIREGKLVSQQEYDVSVVLDVPRSPGNREMGNFMVDVRLLGKFDPLRQVPETLGGLVGNVTSAVVIGEEGRGKSVLYHARRPAILVYESPVVGLVRTMVALPMHVLGFRDRDAEVLKVPMFELLEFKRGIANVPSHVRVEVVGENGAALSKELGGMAAASTLQSYSAKVCFSARFKGLRYVVYNYRVLSFLVFTTLFYLTGVTSMALVWAAVSSGLKKEDGQGVVKGESQKRIKEQTKGKETQKIKEEEEDSSGQGLSMGNVSDSPAQYPSGRGRMPLQYTGRTSETQQQGDQVAEETREGETADDEDEGAEGEDDAELVRRFDASWADARGRYEGDSGIGTSMESEVQRQGPGLTRRRSGRSNDGQR